MNDPRWLFIQFCWATWLVFWVAMSFSTKETVERGGPVTSRLVAGALVLGLIAATRIFPFLHFTLWHTPLALGVVTDCLVVSGLAFTTWARIALGRNWSREVTFKQSHELIETGPYALARHPIYTGLIAMVLGTVINYGRPVGFVAFVALCGGVFWKAREEERLMSRHFPDGYARYKARVHAIIPFVL
jgi:protein-S-isoprenylcysteine O-methyltransferase Ste14